ncbi:hypothetical protein ACERIT_13105 [Halopenitus sp. H-Gu1]|uniref:hypothetical protein n=1 Tax=Halopenitus sp. H-Gu1 TaxID=3242697 RepID=UPI00359DA93A
MSESMGTAGTREVAFRVFASEFDDATLSYSQSDEERAPNYVLTPLGARINRLFAVGVLTEVERVNEDTRRGRVVDPTGAFVTYAGQYQPDEQAFLERADPPSFVALTGKARTFQPEDSDRVFTSVRPESLNAVDADTRDRWVVRAAETTLSRLAVFAAALESDRRGEDLRAALEAGGAAEALAEGIPRAIDHYGTSTAYLEATRRMVIDALELVAGDRDDVRTPDIDPSEDAPTEIGPLPETDVTIAVPGADDSGADSETIEADAPDAGTPTTAAAVGDEDGAASDDPDADDTGRDSVEGEDSEPATAESADRSTEPLADSSASVGGADTSAGGDDDDADHEDAEGKADEEKASEITAGEETGGLGDFADPSSSSESADSVDSAESADSVDSAESADSVDSAESADSTDSPDSAERTVEFDESEATDESTGSEDLYELDEEERSAVTEEYGTDFSTGTEVDDPGEADIDVPTADELAETGVQNPDADGSGPTDDLDVGSADSDVDVSGESPESPDADPATGAAQTESDSVTSEDVDLTGEAIAAMEELDEGDGAARGTVIETVVDRVDADPDAVQEAIDDALMSGKCYEPTDDRLKAI